jgi:deoxyribodipyrimidine photo-lyase
MAPVSIVWLRRDLRLGDNPALAAALARGGAVVPVFIWAPEEEAPWAPGGASRWWLHHSLAALARDLAEVGSRLVIRRGPTEAALHAFARETGASAVFWNRLYEPTTLARDTRIKESLRAAGLEARSFNGTLLLEPTAVKTQTGAPYRVFTPFWRTVQPTIRAGEEPPRPTHIPPPAAWPESLPLEALALLPKIDWAGGMRAHWQPGEAGALALLDRFLDAAVADYPTERDRPDHDGSSRLSPHLHFGEISPLQIWRRTRAAAEHEGSAKALRGADGFLREVGWREFAHHLLFHFPHTPAEPLRPEFARFPWRRDEALLRAWRKGRTGYPIVDAGMRQLWHTGWMHNRVRMVVASFLVKHLLAPWQEGAAWFWDTLVDADLGSNTLGWQWAAGCGADAAPYFRIFNPILQGEKFDPKGDYVRRWVPELKGLPASVIHKPWTAARGVLLAGGVELGESYPEPVVEHGAARERALAALAEIKAGTRE